MPDPPSSDSTPGPSQPESEINGTAEPSVTESQIQGPQSGAVGTPVDMNGTIFFFLFIVFYYWNIIFNSLLLGQFFYLLNYN